MSKILKHLKNGTLFFIIKEKIFHKVITFFTKNERVTIAFTQNYHYNKLKKKFKNTIDKYESNLGKEKSNIVWFCWLQGYDSAPKLVKACFNSLKRNMPNHKIVFLSEKNIDDYIKFPDYIKNKYVKGNISRAHYSDLLRISLLCEYGGIWIDSTVLCTSNTFATYISSLPLFVFKQVDLNQKGLQPIVASNWLIATEKNNEICLLTKKLLFEYWKKYNYAIDYFIFHFFFQMATEKYSESWEKVPCFNNINPHIMQFELNNHYSEERWHQITTYSGFHKLNHHFDYNNNNTIYSKIIDKYYVDEESIENES